MVQLGVLLRAVSPPEERARDRLVAWVQRTGAGPLLTVGLLLVLAATGLGAVIVAHWVHEGFGQLSEVRHAMGAAVLFVIGTQTIFAALLSAFFVTGDFGRPVWSREP
jgi:hypothetical protein